jgi:uncharacterized protein YbaR (Trm112 family)
MACPRCGGTLGVESAGTLEAPGLIEAGLRCQRCTTLYPQFGRIPCLVDDPALWRTLWMSRLESYSSAVETRVHDLRQEAEASGIMPRTRERLRRLAEAFEKQVDAIDALFDPIQAGADLLPAIAIPSRPEPDAPAGVLEGYENLFRDWVWGARECDLALEIVRGALPAAAEMRSVAVYGAGGGRLAVELHQRCGPDETFALAENPLPFLALDRMLAGELVRLVELPVSPSSEKDVVIDRTLSRPYEPRGAFFLLFADPLRPPFAPGSIDLLLTTWFVDVARTDLRQLRPGGLWVNLGPLRFHGVASRPYVIEEALDIMEASGFEVVLSDRHDLPSFDSPVSGVHRTETVYRVTARKVGEAAPSEIPDPLPPWVRNPTVPIPITPALIALGRTSMFTSGILSMIDGTRSVVDVARALGQAWHIEPGRLQNELRTFLAQVPNS